MKRRHWLLGISLSAMAVPLGIAPAAAQEPATRQAGTEETTTSTSQDIVVTARKRSETAIDVPVTITAVAGAELERRGISNLDGLTRMVPQLQLGHGGGTAQGGHVGIRGLSGSDANPFADQAVSFNIDGVQVSRSNIRRMGEMDLAVIEVVKGPQALFFGKNSPAGIISLRSADPTPRLAAKLSVGYEFNAREIRGEGFIAGPISDTLGARLAFYGSKMGGWFRNNFPTGQINSPDYDRSPKREEFALRGTLKWDPSDRFDARLKVSFNKMSDIGILSAHETIFCATATPQITGPGDDCSANGEGSRGNITSYLSTLYPAGAGYDLKFGSGEPYLEMKQALVSFEVKYDITDSFALTSVSGYYYLDEKRADTFNIGYPPTLNLPSPSHLSNKEFTQELRLTSSFDGPVDIVVGGFYQSARAVWENIVLTGSVPDPITGAVPTQVGNYALRQKGTAYSAFGQIIFKPAEQVEITAGGRYSFEKKRLPLVEQAPTGPAPIPRSPVPVDPALPRADSWNNFSPEFTASYRPDPNLNLFVSYKRGFLSGGFGAGQTNFATSNIRYDQQVTKGFEGGVKARLLDGALRTNLAAYRYVTTGLQITTSQIVNNIPVQQVFNAGRSTVQGVEFDFNYNTPVEGLKLRGAIGYNDAKYNRFTTGCYVGQSQAQGCSAGPVNPATGRYGLQNLADVQILRAPKWSGSAGATYETDLSNALRLGFDIDTTFSSSYFTNGNANPNGKQGKYGLIDAGLRLATHDEIWEFALIGRNLTDKYTFLRSGEAGFTGNSAGTGSVAGGLLGDIQAGTSRGREIMARVTWKFGQ